MSSSYRANYHLRSHKRDEFIEFIKSLLLTPFILHSRPSSPSRNSIERNVEKYTEILGCVEELIQDHIKHTARGTQSRLSQLCPSIGTFFTPLPLRDAFVLNDKKRSISGRKQVPPSFNDIRFEQQSNSI